MTVLTLLVIAGFAAIWITALLKWLAYVKEGRSAKRLDP